MIFYLGTHRPGWLNELDVPLFISRTTLASRRTLPQARAPWALDSGGFTALHRDGRWNLSIDDYIAEICQYADEIGHLQWAAPMDWMCEPSVRAKTGLTVRDHQQRTLESFLEIREALTDVGLGDLVIPVLQGWEWHEYHEHVYAYFHAGVDLHEEPIVGLGSVCRRGQDNEIVNIARQLVVSYGLRLHAFGVRGRALWKLRGYVASADSMAWSFDARFNKNGPMDGCTHKSCQNCQRYALAWRERLLMRVASPRQLNLGEAL